MILSLSILGNLVFLLFLLFRFSLQHKWSQSLSRKLWKSFYKGHPEAIFLTDENFTILRLNRAASRLIGKEIKKKDKVSLMNFLRPQGGVSPGDLPILLESRLKGEVRLQLDLDMVDRENQHVPYSVIFTRYYGRFHRHKVFFLCEAVNMEARKRAEMVLRESEERFRVFANHFPGILYQRDWVDHKSYYYGRVESLTGYSHEDLQKGKIQWRQLIHEQDLEEYERSYERALSMIGQESKIEYRAIHRDGRILWFRELRQVLGTSQAEFVQGIIYDITDIKTRELSLSQSQRLAALGRLTSGIAHDFNNNLMIISTLTEYLDRQVPESLKKTVRDIQDGVDAAADLTSRLLVFSRGNQIQKEYFDLNALIQDILPTLDRLVGEGIEMQYTPASGAVGVYFSRSYFEQTMINLAVNSKDALGEKGKITMKCKVLNIRPQHIPEGSQAEPGPFALLEVTDNGCGMDDKTMENIFEPFYSTKEMGNGTGLGLSLVYGFMEDLGGYIRAKSRPGRGTSFFLYFPLQKKPIFSPLEKSDKLEG